MIIEIKEQKFSLRFVREGGITVSHTQMNNLVWSQRRHRAGTLRSAKCMCNMRRENEKNKKKNLFEWTETIEL